MHPFRGETLFLIEEGLAQPSSQTDSGQENHYRWVNETEAQRSLSAIVVRAFFPYSERNPQKLQKKPAIADLKFEKFRQLMNVIPELQGIDEAVIELRRQIVAVNYDLKYMEMFCQDAHALESRRLRKKFQTFYAYPAQDGPGCTWSTELSMSQMCLAKAVGTLITEGQEPPYLHLVYGEVFRDLPAQQLGEILLDIEERGGIGELCSLLDLRAYQPKDYQEISMRLQTVLSKKYVYQEEIRDYVLRNAL